MIMITIMMMMMTMMVVIKKNDIMIIKKLKLVREAWGCEMDCSSS